MLTRLKTNQARSTDILQKTTSWISEVVFHRLDAATPHDKLTV